VGVSQVKADVVEGFYMNTSSPTLSLSDSNFVGSFAIHVDNPNQKYICVSFPSRITVGGATGYIYAPQPGVDAFYSGTASSYLICNDTSFVINASVTLPITAPAQTSFSIGAVTGSSGGGQAGSGIGSDSLTLYTPKVRYAASAYTLAKENTNPTSYTGKYYQYSCNGTDDGHGRYYTNCNRVSVTSDFDTIWVQGAQPIQVGDYVGPKTWTPLDNTYLSYMPQYDARVTSVETVQAWLVGSTVYDNTRVTLTRLTVTPATGRVRCLGLTLTTGTCATNFSTYSVLGVIRPEIDTTWVPSKPKTITITANPTSVSFDGNSTGKTLRTKVTITGNNISGNDIQVNNSDISGGAYYFIRAKDFDQTTKNVSNDGTGNSVTTIDFVITRNNENPTATSTGTITLTASASGASSKSVTINITIPPIEEIKECSLAFDQSPNMRILQSSQLPQTVQFTIPLSKKGNVGTVSYEKVVAPDSLSSRVVGSAGINDTNYKFDIQAQAGDIVSYAKFGNYYALVGGVTAKSSNPLCSGSSAVWGVVVVPNQQSGLVLDPASQTISITKSATETVTKSVTVTAIPTGSVQITASPHMIGTLPNGITVDSTTDTANRTTFTIQVPASATAGAAYTLPIQATGRDVMSNVYTPMAQVTLYILDSTEGGGTETGGGETTTLSASLAVSPTTVHVASPITATLTASGGTAPYTYKIAFGDGQFIGRASGSHSYAQARSYTIVGTVTDSTGKIATDSYTLGATSPVSCTLTASKLIGLPPFKPTFTVDASGGNGSYIVTLDPTGAGSPTQTVSGMSGTYIYTTSGMYSARATVTDATDSANTTTCLLASPIHVYAGSGGESTP